MEIPENWAEEDNMLVREFVLKNFVEAIAFLQKIVPLAEDMNHHPDICVYEYKKVKIKLTTHSAGNTITENDVELARKINLL